MTFKQRFSHPPVVLTVSVINLLFAVTCNLQAAQSPSISLVTDMQMGPAARHGVSKVGLALRAKGIQIEQSTSLETASSDQLLVLGLSREAGPTATLHSSLNIPMPVEAESLLIRHVKWSDKKVLLVSGADDRGLMYALLDVADRIGWAEDPKNPLSEVRNIEEKPAVAERCFRYTRCIRETSRAISTMKPTGRDTLICWRRIVSTHSHCSSATKTGDISRRLILISSTSKSFPTSRSLGSPKTSIAKILRHLTESSI